MIILTKLHKTTKMSKNKICLRLCPGGNGDTLDLFKGDVEKDRAYWKKIPREKSRYFELKEIK